MSDDDVTSGEAVDASPLAQRLDQLFRMSRPDARRWTNNEVAEELRSKHPSLRVSGAYLSALRNGKRVNPSPELLVALADFFGVAPGYFLDQEHSDRVTTQLAMLESLRDAGVRGIAMRAIGLPSESLEAITTVLDQVRKLQGLPPVMDNVDHDASTED
ncbi:helix-turn-helix domain-containing protein [Krasilnikovia sp. MM14-A1004]|uniref:helix-turn-helix domain-containing protein n=1 Tax=Krasilnikovia sp. MM14-A1004 TaxID=3373541 RepID=UPI00399CBAAB